MTAGALQEFEALIQRIHERFDNMSKSHREIAIYLTQNPNEVAVQSVNALADRCAIHASSFVRFTQSLGCRGFKDMQRMFRRRPETAAPDIPIVKRASGQTRGSSPACPNPRRRPEGCRAAAGR